MSAVELRPTFLFNTDLSEDEAARCLKQSFLQSDESSEPSYRGQFNGRHAMISIDEAQRHFWSPWLHLEIRSDDGQRMIAGRFSPHPSIWTAFMFAFLAIGCVTLFAGMFGVSQQMSGQSPWAYTIIPIGLVIALTLWFISKTGQKLAHTEMEQMRNRVEHCLNCRAE